MTTVHLYFLVYIHTDVVLFDLAVENNDFVSAVMLTASDWGHLYLTQKWQKHKHWQSTANIHGEHMALAV